MTWGYAWSLAEDDFIRFNQETLTYRELTTILAAITGENRTIEAVRLRARLIGLFQPRGCISHQSTDNEYMNKMWRKIYG